MKNAILPPEVLAPLVLPWMKQPCECSRDGILGMSLCTLS
jgi:hypothetical protein